MAIEEPLFFSYRTFVSVVGFDTTDSSSSSINTRTWPPSQHCTTTITHDHRLYGRLSPHSRSGNEQDVWSHVVYSLTLARCRKQSMEASLGNAQPNPIRNSFSRMIHNGFFFFQRSPILYSRGNTRHICVNQLQNSVYFNKRQMKSTEKKLGKTRYQAARSFYGVSMLLARLEERRNRLLLWYWCQLSVAGSKCVC